MIGRPVREPRTGSPTTGVLLASESEATIETTLLCFPKHFLACYQDRLGDPQSSARYFEA
jgi:hypothetical protein